MTPKYRLIQQHEPSRREAAVRHAASAPPAFRRFQVGSADALAGDLAALQAALAGDFHRTRYCVARRMQLWLQGPQSLEALGELAARLPWPGLAASEAPPPAPPLRTGEFTALQLAVSSQPALWRCPLIALSDNVTLLREFLLDEAPGSLMASLRQRRRLAGDAALNWLYQDRHLGWLALVFASDRPEEVDRQITHWLQALQQTTRLSSGSTAFSYPAAAFRRCRLSINCASGHSALTPARRPPGSPIFAPPCRPPRRSDWPVRPFPQGSLLPPRALACRLAAGAAALSLTRRWRSLFIHRPLAISFAKCPEEAAPLLHLPSPGEPPRLLLRPPFCCSPDQAEGLARGGAAAPTACRPAPCRGTWRVASVRRRLAVDPPAAGARPTAGGDPTGHPAAARAPGRLADPTAGKYRYPLSHGSTPRTAGVHAGIRKVGWRPWPAAAQKMRSG
ncbi:hypothetical protein MJ588_15145 [Klebsiella pneumoniae]|nr:hypothetical protein MJ588_15145 [Klebsiella pneumoniae]